MAGKSIDELFSSIYENAQAIAKDAIMSAATKVQQDFIKEAENCLQTYYNSYHPRRYKRTKQLKSAITPIFKDNSAGGNISISIGIKYDASVLNYKSNSWYHQSGTTWISRSSGAFDFDSRNNGIPQPDWILNNFLMGIHQWGDGPGEKKQDSEFTENFMKTYFYVSLPKKIDEYVKTELFNAIVSRL